MSGFAQFRPAFEISKKKWPAYSVISSSPSSAVFTPALTVVHFLNFLAVIDQANCYLIFKHG
jgi:hypothetical protein